jgi:hypothetical protein
MAKSIFENLSKVRTDIYDIGNNNTMEITINTLALGDIAEIDMTNATERLQLILRSINGAHPDETIESVKLIPLSVAEKLTENIFNFNGMKLPEDDN